MNFFAKVVSLGIWIIVGQWAINSIQKFITGQITTTMIEVNLYFIISFLILSYLLVYMFFGKGCGSYKIARGLLIFWYTLFIWFIIEPTIGMIFFGINFSFRKAALAIFVLFVIPFHLGVMQRKNKFTERQAK